MLRVNENGTHLQYSCYNGSLSGHIILLLAHHVLSLPYYQFWHALVMMSKPNYLLVPSTDLITATDSEGLVFFLQNTWVQSKVQFKI